jgi:hypothetical protein
MYKTRACSLVDLAWNEWLFWFIILYSSVEDDDDMTREEFWLSIEFERLLVLFCKERRIIGNERIIAWDGDIGEWVNDWDEMIGVECN